MTDRPRYPKSACCVPFCRRTSTLFKDEWLCADHWRLVDPQLKRLRTRLIRRWRLRYERTLPDSRARYVAAVVWRRGDYAIWRRMKAQAIERAAGG